MEPADGGAEAGQRGDQHKNQRRDGGDHEAQDQGCQKKARENPILRPRGATGELGVVAIARSDMGLCIHF